MAKTSKAKSNTSVQVKNLSQIIKRDGSLVDFDITKIENVAYMAMLAAENGTEADAQKIAQLVVAELQQVIEDSEDEVPTVEMIQDKVEEHLILNDYAAAAKAFILYRRKRAELREAGIVVSPELKDLFTQSKSYFANPLGEFVYYRTYSRWNELKGRRETWTETIERFMSFMEENLGKKLSKKEYDEIGQALLHQEIIPSMRLLWSSGKAARKTNVAAYNCSFISISDLKDFSEMMYISMCGCGVGFGVEKESISNLPTIKAQTGEKLETHIVGDSKEGWADAFYLGLKSWFDGKDVEFDYSQVRQKGARLKTMGGRASGPQPLIELMAFARERVFANAGKKLSSLDVHDISCKIGQIVVAGGVRRSAMISLSDLDDVEMRNAKQGQFWNTEPQRSMANNSAIYTEKPSSGDFLDEWVALAKSGTGERGIFNRGGLQAQLPKRRWSKFEKYAQTSGTNPCGEIILRSKQFCNLTAITVKPQDTEESLNRKIRLASILGTYQATLTDFRYLRKDWAKNCEEEALLGVSLTGYYDNPLVRTDKVLESMRDEAVNTNKKYAKKFGINPSTCVTCIKPSGNSSQLLNTSSGMHPRFSKYYVRRVRISSTDPMLQMLKDQGVPCHPEVGQDPVHATTYVLEFPVKSPKDAIVNDDVTALEMLEEWKRLKIHFTEHNPSATIYVGTDEWIAVANWVYENWDIVGGLSFLPRTEHVYQLAPYEAIDKEAYDALAKRVRHIDFSKILLYERQDNTTGAKELACVAGGCEL